MKKVRPLTIFCFVFASSFACAATHSGYEVANHVKGTCPTNADSADAWNFSACNCTSYVAYRINLNGIKFNNSFRQPEGQRWSNAKNWDEAAERAGIPVGTDPLPGDVAQWNENENGVGSYGHVAYVEKVERNSDGTVKYITVSEYNYLEAFKYTSERKLVPGASNYPGRFLQFRLFREGNIAWFPPVSDCSQASQWFYVSTDGTRLPGPVTKDQCPTMCRP